MKTSRSTHTLAALHSQNSHPLRKLHFASLTKEGALETRIIQATPASNNVLKPNNEKTVYPFKTLIIIKK